MKRELHPAVYIMASARNGTLYIGVTSNLVQRVWQHREGVVEGFTHRYRIKTLVWYEQHDTMESAITREKALKKWNRDWKLRLIEASNPDWRDLWPEIVGDEAPHSSQPPARHSREGGNPERDQPSIPQALDSRLRGNDGEAP